VLFDSPRKYRDFLAVEACVEKRCRVLAFGLESLDFLIGINFDASQF
jgi:hypothetical protein